MLGLFNLMLRKEISEILKIDRVHRLTGYRSQVADTPRDVIVRFHYAEEKTMVTEKA